MGVCVSVRVYFTAVVSVGKRLFMWVCARALMRVYVRTRVSNCVLLYSYMRVYMRQRLRTYVQVCTFPIYDCACVHIIV
jgi:hypothetical protein